MRGYIFTDRERELLEGWLESGVETPTLRVLFHQMRRSTRRLISDLRLFVRVARRLRALGRWAGRPSRVELERLLMEVMRDE